MLLYCWNIVKSKIKFKINRASMNDYNYGKLWLSQKKNKNWLKNWNIFMFSTNYLLCMTKKSIKRKAWKEPTKLFPNKGKRKLVVFKTKIINEIKPTLLFSWPASNLVEHFYSCLFPFLTSYVPPLGFDNYHKIAVCGPVHVPKFWHTWYMWVNTKKDISGIILFT